MSVNQNSRKRRYRDRETTPIPDSGCNIHKKQKYADTIELQPPSTFWDNLSTIHLTGAALRELDRRSSSFSRPQRTVHCELMKRFNTIPSGHERRFARQGGPDMSEARGYPAPAHTPRSAKNKKDRNRRRNLTPASSQPLTETTSTRSSGPYNPNFGQHLTDNNIYHDEYQHPDGTVPQLPSNWDAINESLRVAPDSFLPSPLTQEDFRRFKRANAGAFKEKEVTTSVIPIIEGLSKDPKCTSGGIPFRNLEDLTDGIIVPGNPDIFYGARPEQLNRTVREGLGTLIIPSTQDNLPICPNFFVAVKGPDGSLAVASRQALYDGALGARGIYALRNYGQPRPTSYNQAFTITSIYHGGTLKLYTIYRTDESDRPEYHMHQLRSFAMTDTLETFRQGVITYRAAMLWAENQRNTAIDIANKAVPRSDKISENETERNQLIESSSSETSPYTTPPTGGDTVSAGLESKSSATSFAEVKVTLDTNKRARQQAQSSSPAQPKKRNRGIEDRLDPNSTGLSFEFGHYGLQQEDEQSDSRTEVLSSDEEAVQQSSA